MDIQFNKLEGTNLYDELMEGHNWGFKVFRNLLDVNLTALDVADAYYYALNVQKYIYAILRLSCSFTRILVP